MTTLNKKMISSIRMNMEDYRRWDELKKRYNVGLSQFIRDTIETHYIFFQKIRRKPVDKTFWESVEQRHAATLAEMMENKNLKPYTRAQVALALGWVLKAQRERTAEEAEPFGYTPEVHETEEENASSG